MTAIPWRSARYCARALGTVTLVRVRLSHNGATAGWSPEHFYSLEECRGGALIDLGCHPMYLTRLFLGEEAVDVHANFGYITGKEVEDNAVATLSTAREQSVWLKPDL